MQVNSEQVYIIGGSNYRPSLICSKYDVARSCLRVNLVTGVLLVMENMRESRSDELGVSMLGNKVYAVGGKD